MNDPSPSESEPIPCPGCGDAMEHLHEWSRANGDKEPPLVCPTCLTVSDIAKT